MQAGIQDNILAYVEKISNETHKLVNLHYI